MIGCLGRTGQKGRELVRPDPVPDEQHGDNRGDDAGHDSDDGPDQRSGRTCPAVGVRLGSSSHRRIQRARRQQPVVGPGTRRGHPLRLALSCAKYTPPLPMKLSMTAMIISSVATSVNRFDTWKTW